MVGQKLSERLGKPVIVENRPGAGSATGTIAVAKAAPDGYTLLLAPSGTYAINPTLYKQLPYDPVKELAPVALVNLDPLLLVVNPSLPVHSVSDLIKLAKEKPGQLSFASPGAGTSLHLLGELLKTTAGIEMVHVPYRGGAPALQDVIAGQVQLMFSDPASAVPQAKAGRVRALGVSSATRLPAAPEIPTVAEAGLPGFAMVSWQMIAAPAGTPKEIVDKLNAEIKAVMALPEIQKQVTDRGQVPMASPTPAELSAFIDTEIGRWGKIVQQAGLAGSL
jgi:tripartite-type tricarboxylate transporter receptor subunit TctC